MSTGIHLLTKQGLISALRIYASLNSHEMVIYAPSKLQSIYVEYTDKNTNDISYNIKFYEDTFSDIISNSYKTNSKLIFIMATGIVVRTIAPLLRDKTLDPAIVVLDEKLQYVISLIGGHVAGANALALEISEKTKACPVITTATDVNKVGALDLIAQKWNAYNNNQRDLYKVVNLRLAQGEKVYLIKDSNYSSDDLNYDGFEIISVNQLKNKAFLMKVRENKAPIIHLSIYTDESLEENGSNYYHLIPKRLILGIGCKKNTSFDVLMEVLDDFIDYHKIHIQSIKGIFSIDLKKDEQGLLLLAEKFQVPFKTFTVEEINHSLDKIQEYKPSEFVQKTVGVPAVAVPSAFLGSGGQLITSRYAKNGVTIAAGYDAK